MATRDQEQANATSPLLNDPMFDLRGAARAAFGSAVVAGLVGGGLYILGKLTESYTAQLAAESERTNEAQAAEVEPESTVDESATPTDGDVAEAAAVLGVEVDASTDEIRAALRAKLSASRLHPDHGGDGIRARELIDAKNLLIEKLREVES